MNSEVKLPLVQTTAPERIWLAVSDEAENANERFPEPREDLCWSHDEPLAVCVPYVRADIARPSAAGDAVACFRLLTAHGNVLTSWSDGAPSPYMLEHAANEEHRIEYAYTAPPVAAGDAVEYEFEVWQGDAWQAGGSTTTLEAAQGDAEHYAMMYGQDGPVEVKYYEKRAIQPAALTGAQS